TEDTGVHVVSRMHPVSIQHVKRLKLIGVAVVELDRHHCLHGGGGRLRSAEEQQCGSGSDKGHNHRQDHWRTSRDAVYCAFLHGLFLLMFLGQPAICHANASGEEAPRSMAGSSVDQDWTLSW